MGEFVAFRAAIALMKETNNEGALKNIYDKCIDLKNAGTLNTVNLVREIYQPFSLQEISDKIAQLVTPPEVSIPVQVIFQTIEDLHESCPTNLGDWYFTGNYPTPGGNRVVNTAFINYVEGNNLRGY
jgi:amidophosphoribosyltransferase